VSTEKPYQYQYAQHTASDLFMLSETMKAVGQKYDEDVAQQAFEKCWKGEGPDFPLHYLWKAAEQTSLDEYDRQRVRQVYAGRVQAGEVFREKKGSRRENYCPLRSLLARADTLDLAERAEVHEIIRGIEREVPHGLDLFRHLMGLAVGVSDPTISRVKQAALAWLQARTAYDQVVAAWLRS
jgi:hypothetical protein